MEIAVLERPDEHISLRIYREEVTAELRRCGVTLQMFSPDQRVPTKCDLLWDPGLGMRRVPSLLFDSPIPLVVSVLGLRAFRVPSEEISGSESARLGVQKLKEGMIEDWRALTPRLSAVITISRSCAKDLSSGLGVRPNLISPIYLGPNPGLHREADVPPVWGEKYFLHSSFSGYQRKNILRIVQAHQRVPKDIRPKLVLKINDIPEMVRYLPDIEIIDRLISNAEMAALYRGACCLVYPSLYEGFGLPILEAMSFGCPVITSNTTSCPEVAGDAALFVNPRSESEIVEAMVRILVDEKLRKKLSQRGLARAKRFSWARCGRAHYKLLRKISKGVL